jgi:Animal haem peroxidase
VLNPQGEQMLVLKHGGHTVSDNGAGTSEAAHRMEHHITRKPPPTTPFEYLLPALKKKTGAHIPGDPVKVTADLKALGEAMVEPAPAAPTDPPVNSTIPAVYTYWGQFIDHDITANTDRTSATSDLTKSPIVPVPPDTVVRDLRNLRRPTFDLDSVYGNGPGLDEHDFRPDPGLSDKGFYDGIRFRLGTLTPVAANDPRTAKIPFEDDEERDLPRIGELLKQGVITEKDIPVDLRDDPSKLTRAFIGDQRNDENLIVAQFHVAVLRFHNEVVNAIEANPKAFGLPRHASDAKRFETARRLVRFHYQWLVVHDYLETVTMAGTVDKVLVGGNRFYKPLPGNKLFAPIEYSVAAFRFGHTMVRGAYDHNRNFGKPVPPKAGLQGNARFAQLFEFTGNGFVIPDPAEPTKSIRNPLGPGAPPTLTDIWPIEWDRMTNKADPDVTHFARRLDARLVNAIHNMVNEGNAPELADDSIPTNKLLRVLLRSLAQRNLLRGYQLSVPTGQAVADEMKISKLSEAELRQGNSEAVTTALEAGGFLRNTPLWFYILKEADVRGNGNSLGELGSRIIAETQIGLIRNDRRSYLNADGGWDPSDGVKLPNGDPIVTIRDFFAFAKLPA